MNDREREMIRCAKVNLDNLASMVPGLDKHPFFAIVHMQLDSALEEENPTRQDGGGS